MKRDMVKLLKMKGDDKMQLKNFIKNNNIKIENGIITYFDLETRQKASKKLLVNLKDVHDKMCKVEYLKEYQKVSHTRYEESEGISMMPFAYVYYYYFAKNLQIPYPNEFVKTYFKMFCYKKQNGKWAFKERYDITHKKDFEFRYAALKARILRSYNSFNREIELLIKLNIQKDMKIEYDLYNDLFLGIDLKILYNNKQIKIAEYVGTSRSKMHKHHKNDIHDYDKNTIDVIAVFHGDNKNVCSYGEIYCYDNNVITKLKKRY